MGDVAYRQAAPNSVQIEPVEGCNLRCTFCGLHGIRGKANDLKFLDPAILYSSVDQMVKAGWNPRIEFAVHGEPTMHPDLDLLVDIVRKAAPTWQILITCNGGGLLKKPGPAERIRKLFDVGLTILALDDYDGVGLVPKIRNALLSSEPSWDHVHEYPLDKDGNPHIRRKPGSRTLVFVADVSNVRRGDGTHSYLNNSGGVASPPNDRMRGKRCAKPFREMTIRWDGNVAVCCNDWRGSYKCGNIVTDGLEHVWQGPAMEAARRKLYAGERDFGPCNGCDAVSYRVGLLPDKRGVESLPPPDKGTQRRLEEALVGPSYTTPIKREWENARTRVG